MFKKIFNWLNNKKTAIGWSLVAVSEIIPNATISIILKVSGVIIGGTGVIHKIKKGDFKGGGTVTSQIE